MKRPSYREAIAWIATNDDCEWLESDEPIPSVTVIFMADLFDVDVDKVVGDLRRQLSKMNRLSPK